MVFRQPAQDAEDGADVDIDVDIGRAVQRIEDDDVAAGFDAAVEGHRLLVLLADQRGDGVAQPQTVQQRLVGKDVQLLLLLALHVGLPDRAQDIAQAGRADLGLDHLGCQRDAAEEPTEPAAGLADLLLLLQDVLLHCRNHCARSPQGLKPHSLSRPNGRAKARPYQNGPMRQVRLDRLYRTASACAPAR